MSELPKVVVIDSQSLDDVKWTAWLVVQLRVLKGELTVWDESQIAPGDDRVARIEAEAATANLAVLMVSADLLTSDLVEFKVVPALRKAGVRIIPLLTRPCAWQAVPWLEGLEPHPRKGRPLSTLKDGGETEIAALVQQIRELLHVSERGGALPRQAAPVLNGALSVASDVPPPRVFLSYSHDDDHHLDRVLILANRLREAGVDAWLDQYEVSPPEGWPRWMERQIKGAAFVLVVCTEIYRRRFDGDVPKGSGHGVKWEGAIVHQSLYDVGSKNERFVPVLFSDSATEHVPTVLRGATWYNLADETGFEDLYRHLTRQPATPPPPLGDLRQMPERPVLSDFRGETEDELEALYRKKAQLETRGEDITTVVKEILEHKRRQREGAPLAAGEILGGRYELLKQIGEGGFARVWKAFDRKNRTVVALKILHAQYANAQSRRERFFRGAREMAKLRENHRGIVRVIEDEVEDRGLWFFVMEYLGGGDLRQAVLAGKLSPEERMAVVREVGEVLAYAHAQGVIHRDVKPANVLLDLHGHARLTDFDLVRAGHTTGGTRTGTGLGTFLYAPPESLLNAAEAGEPADVYGLGMTAAFTLYGADLPPEVMRDAPGFVRGLKAPVSWLRAIERAVEWKTEDRWASVADFYTALTEVPVETEEPIEIEVRDFDSPTLTEPWIGPLSYAGEIEVAPSVQGLFRWIETPLNGRVALWREIPAGEGWIGSPDGVGYDDERPRHKIRVVRPFALSVVPVTNAQFAAFASRHRFARGRDNHPIVYITWRKVLEFCHWLAMLPGFEGARLPTEWEWEYACRARRQTMYWSSDNENDPLPGWHAGNSESKTHQVGEKSANPWGLYDMHGNVWEWTASIWRNDYSGFEAGLTSDPTAMPEDLKASLNDKRVIRGGSSGLGASYSRSAYREGRNPGAVMWLQGFRVLLPLASRRSQMDEKLPRKC